MQQTHPEQPYKAAIDHAPYEEATHGGVMPAEASAQAEPDRPAVGAQRRQAGFTLIELVIVLVVLGILASVAVPQFAGIQDQARAGGLASSLSSAATTEAAKAATRGGNFNASSISTGMVPDGDFSGFAVTNISKGDCEDKDFACAEFSYPTVNDGRMSDDTAWGAVYDSSGSL